MIEEETMGGEEEASDKWHQAVELSKKILLVILPFNSWAMKDKDGRPHLSIEFSQLDYPEPIEMIDVEEIESTDLKLIAEHMNRATIYRFKEKYTRISTVNTTEEIRALKYEFFANMVSSAVDAFFIYLAIDALTTDFPIMAPVIYTMRTLSKYGLDKLISGFVNTAFQATSVLEKSK